MRNLEHSDDLNYCTIDTDALLSILVDSEFEYTSVLINGGNYSIASVVDWFVYETLDNIDVKSPFTLELKSYVYELANTLIPKLSEHRLQQNEYLRYCYEGCTHGGSLRFRKETYRT